jgi:integrase/recombinase XerC
MNSLVLTDQPALPAPGFDIADVRQLVADFYAGRKESTLRAYQQALCDFALYLAVECAESAARLFLSAGQGGANAIALRYRADMVERHLAASTINSRLSALRSLVQLARTVGLVSWSIEVRNVKSSA